MALDEYGRKRDFKVTAEPPARVGTTSTGRSFVVQKHRARQLHYDFRLELGGVLKSWSVPKGPCLDPAAKRLAVAVEDHPIDYGEFEGIIPKGQYGGGTVLLWDRGVWEPLSDPVAALAKGHLKFQLHGEKLRGRWALVRLGTRARGRDSADQRSWLLVKDRDEHARPESEWSVTEARSESVATGRDMDAIAAASDRVWHSHKVKDSPAGSSGLSAEAPAAASRARKVTATRVAGVGLTHPGRVLYPDAGVTKLDLALFYQRVAERMLPHLVDRPLTLVRAPNGVAEHRFFVRHAVSSAPRELGRVEITGGTGSGMALVVDDVSGLVALAQMNVIEVHPWNARTSAIDEPDRMIFDLDPGPEMLWSDVVDGAKCVRDVLASLDLASFVKTTGGKGLHVVVPLAGGATWADTLDFSRAIARALERFEPARFSAGLAKAGRENKIFVDYLRNRRGATAASVYSSRAHAAATVSVPVTWEELGFATRNDAFHVWDADVWHARRDPWADYGKTRQRLDPPRLRAVHAVLERAPRATSALHG